MLVDGIDYSGARVAFIIFWAPVNELCGVHISAFLFGGAIASEVSLLSTVETFTLYSSLGWRIVNPSYVSSL